MASRFTRWIPRVSLREFLGIVTFVAVTLVAMMHASPLWVAIVGILTVLAWTCVAILAAIEKGEVRAVAIGFLVAMVAYAATVVRDPPVTASYVVGRPFVAYDGYHPAVVAMSEAWKPLATIYYVERGTDKKLKEFNPSFDISLNVSRDHIYSATQIRTGRRPGYGFVGGEGLIGVAVPGNLQWPDWYLGLRPSPKEFFEIGHCLWAIAFGYLGARFALFVYHRRQLREDHEKKEVAAAGR